MSSFTDLFLAGLIDKSFCFEEENWPEFRYGPQVVPPDNARLTRRLTQILSNLPEFEQLFKSLEDNASRAILLEVQLFHALSYRHVRMSLNTPAYQEFVRTLLAPGNALYSVIQSNVQAFRHTWLHHFKVQDFEVLCSVAFLIHNLFHGQYRLSRDEVQCKVEPGDVVIDGGACFGDTTLWFASQAGPEGRVWAFEFTEQNVEIFRKNMALNPTIASRIALVRAAMSNVSNQVITYQADGQATTLHRAGDRQVATLSIDDLVEGKSISKVDFIKMDIEGFEMKALLGAERTIRRFRPKLALSLYHMPNDIYEIPLYIREKYPFYKLYLNHHTIFGEETVLYAVPV